jgi:hypothetical protein
MRIRDGLLVAGLGLLLAGCPDKDKQQTPEEPVDNTPKVEEVYQEPEVLEEPETTLEEVTEDKKEKPIVRVVDGVRYEITELDCECILRDICANVKKDDGEDLRVSIGRFITSYDVHIRRAYPNLQDEIIETKDIVFRRKKDTECIQFERFPQDGKIDEFTYQGKRFTRILEPKEGECAWKGPASCAETTRLAGIAQKIHTTYTEKLLTPDLCKAPEPKPYSLDKL